MENSAQVETDTQTKSLKKRRRASHLLLLLMVVVAGRFVRRSRKVVRSITLVVHHIQAAHSDEARCSVRSGERSAVAPASSHGLYPRSCRCLHICPNAYNGHAARQCASRCALRCRHPGQQNGSKSKSVSSKTEVKIISDRSSGRF